MTSTGSHLMGAYYPLSHNSSLFCCQIPRRLGAGFTFAAEKMSLTDWAISGPIPSPSIMVTVYFPYRNKSVRLFILTRILSVSLRLDSRHQCLVDRSGNNLRYKAKWGGRKIKYFNGGTYIGTLLTLELGNPFISSRGVATELRPWLACIVHQTRRAKYLRNRRRKAWGHPCCPQALTRGGNEGSSRDHGGRTRGSLPEDKSKKKKVRVEG